jgi:hypothetical protein
MRDAKVQPTGAKWIPSSETSAEVTCGGPVRGVSGRWAVSALDPQVVLRAGAQQPGHLCCGNARRSELLDLVGSVLLLEP